MFRGLATVLLLVVSNAFMTLAWYGHIAFKSRLERFGLTAIVLLSWGIALFEYCFQVPANRIGSAEFGGPFSICRESGGWIGYGREKGFGRRYRPTGLSDNQFGLPNTGQAVSDAF